MHNASVPLTSAPFLLSTNSFLSQSKTCNYTSWVKSLTRSSLHLPLVYFYPGHNPQYYSNMPRYHALEASVSLSVWAPGPEFADVSSAPLMTSQARIKNRRNKPANPANGQPVVVLDEDAFVGQEGVSFLGPAMPFFLVDSGKNLFQDTPATNSNRSLNDRFRSSGQPTPTTSAPSRHLRQSSRSLRSASRAPSNGTPEPGLSLKQSPQKVSRISTTCMREKSLGMQFLNPISGSLQELIFLQYPTPMETRNRSSWGARCLLYRPFASCCLFLLLCL